MNTAQGQFTSVRTRARRGIYLEGVARVAVTLFVFALVTYFIDRSLRLEVFVRATILFGFCATLAWSLRRRVLLPLRFDLSDKELAVAVERHDPSLNQSLISALQFESRLAQQKPDPESRQLMQATVDGLQTRLDRVPFHRALSWEHRRRYLSLAGLACATWVGLFILVPQEASVWLRRNLLLSTHAWSRATQLEFVGLEGNEVRIAEHDDLNLELVAGGLVPAEVELQVFFVDGREDVVSMDRLGDDRFSATLSSIPMDAEVVAIGGDGESPRLRLRIVARPSLKSLDITLEFPTYLERPAEQLAHNLGEIEVLQGSTLHINGEATKPLTQAKLSMGNEVIGQTTIGQDPRNFSASLIPDRSGVLSIEVLDQDRLGTGQPHRLSILIITDDPPELDYQAQGVGVLVTRQAMIPGQLLATDDFGLASLTDEYQIRSSEEAEDSLDESQSFRPGPQNQLPLFQPGTSEFRNDYVLDLLPLSPDENPDAPANIVRPGQLLGLRFRASDYCPGSENQSQQGVSETLFFRIVSPETLLAELRRRQAEQRRELLRIFDDESEARDLIATIGAPGQAFESMLAAQLQRTIDNQQELRNRTQGVSDSYRAILDEFANNRLIEASDLSPRLARVVLPLQRLVDQDFQRSIHQSKLYLKAGEQSQKDELVNQYNQILRTLSTVLEAMAETESLAAIIEELQLIIRLEERVRQEVKSRRNKSIEGIFSPPPTKRKNGEESRR